MTDNFFLYILRMFDINSLDHMFGTRRFDTPDTSRNNALLALITLGEGWHDYHHNYAVSARQGFRWWETDITYMLMKLMDRVGIVRDLRPLPVRLRSGWIGLRQVFSLQLQTGSTLMRIAIVGTGISGMTSAYLLSEDHEVTVYEAKSTIGGHTATVDVDLNGRNWPVDTGFIVFNHKTYPHFTRLMDHLGVASQPSVMSFSFQDHKSGLVFCPSSFNSLFIQRKNLLRPAFHRMLLDALRFRRGARKLLDSDDDRTTLEAYLATHHYSTDFIDNFLIPMGAAIWSAGPGAFRKFPARYFIEFFENHGFLNISDQPQWRVIKGGSRNYIGPITRPFANHIRLNSPVSAVTRSSDKVSIKTVDGRIDNFDHVVIAAHSDQALAMLVDPSATERAVLGRIGYQENQVVLHTDTSVLPPQQAAWASWNYLTPERSSERVALTYNMNMLQNLDAPETFCVSLNIGERIDPAKVIRHFVYHHPIYTPDSLVARRRHTEISGVNRTSFCGAYWGYGFHEDGVNSALAVCRAFGKDLP